MNLPTKKVLRYLIDIKRPVMNKPTKKIFWSLTYIAGLMLLPISKVYAALGPIFV